MNHHPLGIQPLSCAVMRRILARFEMLMRALHGQLHLNTSDKALNKKLHRQLRALGNIIARVRAHIRIQDHFNTNLAIIARVATDPKFRATVRAFIGERAIRIWRLKQDGQYKPKPKFKSVNPQAYASKDTDAFKRREWKPYALYPVLGYVPSFITQGDFSTFARRRPSRLMPTYFYPWQLENNDAAPLPAQPNFDLAPSEKPNKKYDSNNTETKRRNCDQISDQILEPDQACRPPPDINAQNRGGAHISMAGEKPRASAGKTERPRNKSSPRIRRF